MTESRSAADETFEVSSAAETVVVSTEYEGANVCRVGALSTRFGDRADAYVPLGQEYAELGFSDRIVSPELRWSAFELSQLFENIAGFRDRSESRIGAWQALNETGRPREAFAFLINVLGSPLERESAAAAAALWRQLAPRVGQLSSLGPRWWRMRDRLVDFADPSIWPWPWSAPGVNGPDQLDPPELVPWDPELWQDIFERATTRLSDYYTSALLTLWLVRWRLERAFRSPDPVTVSFAMAAFDPAPADDLQDPVPPSTQHQIPPGPLVVSTIIHGTWGWKGDWWRPGSTFHEFVLRNHRPNLFSRGAKYSWSGALSEHQRVQAAGDFCDWAYDVAPNGLQTVFGHSYGGEVAARAVLNGARVSELVLLSVPVTAWVEMALPYTPRTVDVRLRFDPVLALAQTRQRITTGVGNTTSVLLKHWRYSHGATHEESVWRDEDVARRGQI